MNPLYFGLLLFGRILLNMSYRMVYPFLPALSRGVGLSFEKLAVLATLRSTCGLVSPFVGSFLDRKGYRLGLFYGILVLFAGASGIFVLPGPWGIVFFFVATGLSKALYDPAVQAYVSSFFPYERRARGIGVVETAWAASWFVGMPICALALDGWGWKGPFAVITFWSCIAAASIGLLPKEASLSASGGSGATISARSLPIFVMSFFMTFANENVIIVYGAWMESEFGLKLGALGFLSFVIGSGELAGEVIVALLGDRLGKKEILMAGLLGLALVYLALLPGGYGIVLVTAMLWFMFLLSEIAIVSSFAFISEIAPEAKGHVLSINYACGLAGRLMGSLTGPVMWHWGKSIAPNAVLSSVCAVLAFWCLRYYSQRTRSWNVRIFRKREVEK